MLEIGLAGVMLLLTYAVIAGVEKALFSLSMFQIVQLKDEDDHRSKILSQLLEHFGRVYTTVLLVKFLIVFLIAALSVVALNESGLTTLSIIAMDIVIIAITEFVVSIPAQRNSAGLVRFSVYPLLLFYYIFFPITWLLTKILGKKFRKQAANISLEEISDVIEKTDLSSETDQDEANLLKGVVRFSDIEAKSVMKERIMVTAIEKSSLFENVWQTITESGYSRFPVYEENLDHIVGVLVLKDLLPLINGTEQGQWQTKIRPALFVEEDAKIDDLLPIFQSKKNHFAIVVDEYGGTSGIITLEDILEEIVGEITDESDNAEEEQIGVKIDEHQWEFEANTSINDFCKVLNLEEDFFETVQGNAESLGGLVLGLCGTFPDVGQEVSFKNITLIVAETDDRRIQKIKVVIQ
ncbi:MAG: CNNM domain-containing protein [Bacteroidales bacterium]|nr:CNNM domain-containing protein [Bacteroidales bacterium]